MKYTKTKIKSLVNREKREWLKWLNRQNKTSYTSGIRLGVEQTFYYLMRRIQTELV